MTGDVRAWARGRLAKAIRGGHFSDGIPNEWLAADAVLAVLPELLTDERVVQIAASTIAVDAPRGSARLVLAKAAQALAGAS